MENNAVRKVKNLIDDFVDEKENGFYETVYEKYYAYLADSFSEAVNELCRIIIFGCEYSLSVKKLYNYDSYLAFESWRNYVNRSLEEDFHEWVSEVVQDDLEDFTSEFQKWLAKLDDEWIADVAVALLNGEIDATEIIVDWLRYRMGYEAWKYPA